ncbi:MAG: hypothetical protein AAF488_07865 [Planctomycetota bacterium]
MRNLPILWVVLAMLGISSAAYGGSSSVLIYDTSISQTSALAATGLGHTVTSVSSENDFFNAYFAPGSAFDLLILEIPTGNVGDDFAFTVFDHVEQGGKAILFYGEIDSGASDGELFRMAFGVTSAVGYSPPVEIDADLPSHPIWTTPNPVLAPIVPAFDLFGTDGGLLTPAPGSTLVASSTTVGPIGGLVVVRGGDSAIINGFLPDNYDALTMEPFVGNQIEFLLSQVPTEPEFVRGDANADGTQDISDAVFSLAALFTAGAPPPSCEDAADANDDGGFDISDPVSTLATLFSGGPSPSEPFPTCGVDPTGDALGCDSYPCP